MVAFGETLEAVQRLQAEERANLALNPACHTIVLQHGERRPRAVALLHGITSSPAQFADFGQLCFEHGANVFIPRMPHHGFKDRLTQAPAETTVHEFLTYARSAITMALGLGEHVTLAGLSVSGTLAAWCAQTQPGLDQAILLSPAMAPLRLPMRLVPPFSALARKAPNVWWWWDPRQRAKLGPETSYPRFSTHAMAIAFAIGGDVYEQARHTAPATTNIVSVVNRRDMAVSYRATNRLTQLWQCHGARVRRHMFDGEVGHLHDFIGPYQPGARPDLVYPLLWELIDQRA